MDLPGAVAALDIDLPCRNCGFNLRGLSPDRACPECGTSIELSLREPLLRFAEPGWVRTLARGATWVLAGVLVGFIAGVAAAVVAAQGAVLPAVLIASVPQVPYVLGIWWLTSPEPGGLDGDDPVSRAIARWGAVTAVAIGAASIALINAPALTNQALDTVEGLAGTVAYFALLVYTRKLALRLPDARLAKHTRTVMWGIVVSYGVIVVGAVVLGVLVATGPNSPGGPPNALVFATAVPLLIGGAGTLVFGIWSLVLLFQYRSRLTLAAEQAADAWTTGDPAATP
jgi:hypothetical protein